MTQPLGPLEGIRIIDLTSMLSGPWATMILADQGADVIKVEEPRLGDHTRAYGNRRPQSRVLNTSFVFWGERGPASHLKGQKSSRHWAKFPRRLPGEPHSPNE